MSSALAYDPSAGQKVIGAASRSLGANDAIARLGLSQRQQELNRWWALYRCEQYSTWKTDWDGRPASDGLRHDFIASGNLTPPGFYDASGATTPLKFRKPNAPYQLGRVIVNRFTGLLFSSRNHPKIKVPDDPDTEDYLTAMAEASRIWAHAITARTMGGAMGSVAMGFQFVEGQPRVEVHDARWCTPTFEDREILKLKSIEKRYQYPEERYNPDTGQWEEIHLWYRRIIDDQTDTLFKPAPVGNGEEPKWEVANRVEHGLGFCPVVWIQNTEVLDSIDGDPDCHGVSEMLHSIDMLLAQSNAGTIANCDPTVVVKSAEPLSGIKKGSDNAIKLGPDGDAHYMELSGAGAKSAVELAKQLRDYVLEVTQCVLDMPQGNMTATEVERRLAPMLDRADIFREQYGERGIKPLLVMMVKAARLLASRPEPQVLSLPKRQLKDPNDPSKIEMADRKIGDGGNIDLQWPRYFIASATDTQAAVTAAVAAKTGGLVDAEHASRFVADAFQVEDVQAMVQKIAADKQARQDAMTEAMMNGGGGGSQPPQGDDEEVPPQRVPVPRRPPPPGGDA